MGLTTPRGELLGALLRCDKAGHDLQNALLQSSAVRVQLAELADALRALVRAAEMLDRSSPDNWCATGYGLPPWLCNDPRHGVSLVFDLLTQGDWLTHLTSYLDGDGRPMFDESEVDLFLDVLSKLEEAQTSTVPPHLLPGRIGDPALGYGDLARALLAEHDTTLAATSTLAFPLDGQAARLAARLEAWDSNQPVGRELLARLLRVDVPVIHRGGVGMVIGMQVELSAPDDPREWRETHAAPGTKVSRAFRDGVVTGHITALKLLESIGAPEALLAPVRSLRYSFTELVEGSQDVDGDSAGLPVALHVIARALGLERPPWIPTGSFEKNGTLKPIDDRAAGAKARAVEVEGLWQGLTAHFAGPAPAGISLPLTGTTLEDACAQLWPDAWPESRERVATGYLANSGCTVQNGVPPDLHALTDDHGDPIGVQAAPHDQVLHYLREYPAVPVVLAGPPGVGKSWTLRSVAGELESEGWSVLVLRFRDNHLPSPSEAARCAEFALDLYSPAARERSLLVVEDLVATPDATDLEAVLLEILDVCQCPVVAVAVAQRGSGLAWRQAALHVVGMPHDTEALVILAESLVSAFPQRFGAAAGCEGIVVATSQGDRWWLVRLLDYAAQTDSAGDLTPAELREAYMRERVGDLDPAQWHAAELLAAYSSIDILAPARQLQPLEAAELERLGAYRTVSGSDVFWRLPSPAARFAILCRKGGVMETQLRAPVSEILRLLLDGTEMAPVVRCLAHLRGIFDARLLHSISNDLRDPLVSRIKQHADASELAHAIQHLFDLPDKAKGELVQQLADRLIYRGWPMTRVGDLVTCLRVLETNDYLLASAASSPRELDDLWEALLQGLWQALQLLTPAMAPSEALGLLKTLERLRRTELTRPGVALLCIEGLSHADPSHNADVFLAIELAETARRFSRREGRRGNNRTPLEELVDSPGWKRLAGSYGAVRNAADYLARLALQDMVRLTGETPPTAEELEAQLLTLLPRTPLVEFTQTLYLLRKHHSATLGLLRHVRLDESLAGRINTESPHTVAHVLLLLARLQPSAGQRLLYDTDGQPRMAFAESLISRIRRTGDLRVLSFVLGAVGELDQEFFYSSRSFGDLIAARLFPMFKRIHGERGRVVLYLTQGLISVDFDRKHLQALRPQFLSYLADAFARDYRAGDEAELALILAADETLDGSFLADMREALDTDVISRSNLLSKMKRGQTPGALAHYHALALALDPGMSNSYRAGHPSPRTLVGSLRDRRLPSVLDAVQAVSRTLAYAHYDTAVPQLLSAIEATPQGWARRILQLRHPGDLARAVNLLSDLDPQLARSALEATQDSRLSESGGLLMVVLSGRAEPEEALEMLTAVRSAHPEIGRRLIEQIAANRMWRQRLRGMLQIEHPAVLGQALYRLAALGLEVEARDARELERVWSDVMGQMASPWTVGQLLRGAAAVDARLGHRLADRVDAGRLRSRLTRLRACDGGSVGVLLLGLTHAGRAETAESIAEQFVGTSLTALSLRHAVNLCRAVLDIDCRAGTELARRVRDDVLLAALDRQLVRDPDEHLMTIGWLARLLGRLGCPPPRRRWKSGGLEHPAARLWAEVWLAPTPDRTAEVNGLLDDIAACSRPPRPWRSALILVAAARAGRLADAVASGLDRNATQGAGAEWQAELYAVPELR